MKNRFWKKTAAGLLALLIIAGAAPVKPVTDLFGGAAITASAEGEIEGVTYIDENGEEQTISEYTVLDENTTELTEGWYVVDSSFTNPNTLKPSGNVNIILTDDHTMNLEGDDEFAFSGAEETTTNLTIYGQSKGTGKIVLSSFCDISVCIKGSLTINGGTWISDEIYVNGTDPGEDCLTFNGGNINIGGFYYSIYFDHGKCSINGGQVNLTSYQSISFDSKNTISLGYTKATDLIYTKNPLSDGANVRIADGMVFTDGTNIYDSSTPSETLSALTGVTLTPANAHNITAAPAENGTVTVPTKAFAGDTVTLSVAPDAGHTLRSITVKDADGNAIPVSKNQFTMPEGDVTVTAEFEVLEEFPDDGMLIIGTKYAFTPDEDGIYSFKLTNEEALQMLLITGEDGISQDISSVHLKAGKTYFIRAVDMPSIGEQEKTEVTWEKLSSYNIGLPDTVENGSLKLYRINYTALYDTTDTLALAGDEMAIIPTAEEGFALNELTVTAGGKPVELTKKESVTSQGTITYYSFIMPEENVTVSAGFEEKAFSDASLTLGDDLVLNFYSDLVTDENYSEYTVKFSGSCADKSSSFTEKDGQYRASAHIYAKDINAEITATLYKGDEQIGVPLTYSAAKYLEDLSTNTDSSDTLTHELITATLNFGNASEEYFYGTDLHTIYAVEGQLTGAYNISGNDELKEALAPYAADFTSDEARISLVLDSKTAIRLYIKGMQAGTQDDYGMYTSVSGSKSTDEYPSYFEISGLLPQDLAKEQSITVDGRTYKFSALSWADRVMSQEEPSERNVTMAKAVTAYYLAAHDYYVDQHTVDLSQLTDDYYAKDGDILTGTTDSFIYVSGVTVTLKDAEAQNGIDCDNNSTILLEGTNKAKIYVGYGTLTIDGEGSLTANGTSHEAGIGGYEDGNLIINGGIITATGGDYSAGIGGSQLAGFGDITINGGNVTAIGGLTAPGIGTTGHKGGKHYKCGDITINGGTVTATGGDDAPGIGSVYIEECGNITIADTVKKVTVTKGEDAPYCIGTDGHSICGTITIGGNVYYNNGEYENGGEEYLKQDTIVYPEPIEGIDLSALTADYTAKNGDILTGELKENVKISVEDGAKVTLKNVTINGVDDKNYKWAGITCEGDADLIIEGVNTVSEFYHDYPGIYIAPEKTLTIDGNGTLNASSEYHAGIGGGYRLSCGNIVINGGTINAAGSSAGIGGGYNDDRESVITCGDITINGGNVTAAAIGGSSGSGIGSGHSIGGNITITGGTVIATSDRYSPGIGCSVSMDGESSCGDIIISGGNVTATGGESASGIGTGNNAKCGNITISGGNVTATGGVNGPGIGAGYSGECGDITISGGTVYAESTDVPEQSDCAAGIGTGLSGKCGAILISGGTVTAVGVDYGSAIGSEFGNKYDSVTIKAGVTSVTVQKGKDATYYFGKPFEESSNVTIEDGANIIKI